MLTIENFGLRWRRDKILWSRSSKNGSLPGALRRSKQTIVDFSDQIGIYVLFNAGEGVYVGQAGIGNKRLFGRLKDHTKDHLRDRWTHFSWFGLRGYNKSTKRLSAFHKPETAIRGKNRKDALYEIEAVLIAAIEPNLNKQGATWTSSREFLQYIDPKSPKTQEEIIAGLPRELKELASQISILKKRARNR
jgi:hypothetical protein